MEHADVGIVLPILPEHVVRLFEKDEPVIVKYISRIPKKQKDFRLRKGMKVLFYVSQSKRRLAGEAELASVEFLSVQETRKRYQQRLLLSTLELERYAQSQPNRENGKLLLVLSLTKIRKYPDGKSYFKNISMVGEYVKEDVYRKIMP